jgi:hypothetical protein
MDFDIEFINETAPTVIDSDNMQAQFERDYELDNGTDIGGLMVYTEAGKVVGVYDYENFVGWVV